MLSVSSNYIFRKGYDEDIGTKVKYIIADLENKKNEDNINVNKNKEISKIIYSNENNTEIKLIKLMLKLKSECNKIIYPNKEEVEFEEDKNKESIKTDKIIFLNYIKNIKKKNVNISISDIAKFIAYGK